ncbi:MAG: ABC transporter substrate-binding protein [Clostridiales bacterium]|nr:ABC transporter substrate-binding protein [Clostridiales bacterium]
MHKIKRIIIAALAIIVVAGMAAGCGNSGGTTAAPGGSPAGSAPAAGGGAAAAPSGDVIKIGYCAPFTGPLAVFTTATKWVDQKCLAVINDQNGGVTVAGKKYKIDVVYADTQSDSTVATQVAQKLVLQDKVNILVGAWTPTNSGPVSAVGERYGIPTYISNSPAESWIASGGPYHWAFGCMFYMKDLEINSIGALDKLDTNKKVGFVFDSGVDGVTISAMLKPMLEAKGYTVFDPGRFPQATTDYTDIIKKLQAQDCDIVLANMVTPDFATMWKQFHQLGYVPKAFNIGKAVHFQADAESLGGDYANGLLSEVLWDPSFPYKSNLLNETCAQVAADWENENHTQFPPTLGYDVTLWEVMNNALPRAASLQPADIRTAILATNMDGIYGHIQFDQNQVAPVPCITVQWHKGTTWPWEKTIVSSVTLPEIPAQTPFILPDTTQKN